MEKLNFEGGILNPLNSNNFHFDYEVVEQSAITHVEYEDEDGPYVQPECMVILKSLSSNLFCDTYCCTLSGEDAFKPLRPGELVTAILKFNVKKNDNGSYKQIISASDVYTLNDYQEMREAEALYKGSLAGNKQATA